MSSHLRVSFLIASSVLTACGQSDITNSSLKGTPDQDIVVATIRDQFERGTLPPIQGLRFGKKWTLQTYSSIRNVSKTEVISASFVQNGQVISLNGTTSGTLSFVYTNSGLEASMACLPGCVWQKIILRAGGDGQIYGEQVSQPDAANLPVFSINMYRSSVVNLANQNYFASNYMTFTPAN